MTLLNFTLSEEGVAVFHDALVCLNKFSDSLCLEVRADRLVLTTFNSTKSAYARFTFDSHRFCSNYRFDATGQRHGRFYCAMLIHSLLPIFVRRSAPSSQAGISSESSIERCDVTIEDDAGRNSRFIARVVKRNGISATHRLPFENLPPVHAKFDKEAAVNMWVAPARNLRQLLDHFSPGTELLDIHLEDPDPNSQQDDDAEGVINFTCFTEKTVSGDQVLKKPLHTSIAVSSVEFAEMSMEEKLHITITVKDFKSIVYHANMINGDVTARFSTPAKPMQLSYPGDGFNCEFLLMTVGERTGDGTRRKKNKPNGTNSNRPALDTASRAGSVARSSMPPHPDASPTPRASEQHRPSSAMPPRVGTPTMSAAAASRVSGSVVPRSQAWKLRPSNIVAHPPRSNYDSDSLFVTQQEPEDEEESRWEPINEDDDTPGWGGSNLELHNNNGPSLTMNRVWAASNPANVEGGYTNDACPADPPSGLDPTQKLTDVKKFGLFG
ncbi:DNA repair protein rad9 [Zalerion maritima]|uniref:DNA repair protein rad9 n=1 Tax=Zalerion maritima TaxID=339359 RepID=A0AAD5RPE8_9PEZI|nr:DNA repair protein rad9 [Zalerion maritima]